MPFELKPDETGNLHLVGEEMPCGPRQTSILYWGLPNAAFSRVECEEAAARLIAFSRLFGAWVGVSWSRIVEMCEADFALNNEAMEAPLKGATPPEFPASLIYEQGFGSLFLSFQELRAEGMVRIEYVMGCEDNTSIIYPTEKLVRRIMEVQNIAA